MQLPALHTLPGFRRRFRITPGANRVHSEVEDDFHCMAVTIRHDGTTATAVEADMMRAPWSTCPGAVARVRETFTGIALSAFADRGKKRTNCTHLHDLAVLGAAHAFDAEPLVYDVLVSDPVDGARRAELLRNGATVLGWTELDDRMIEPAELGGLTLFDLGPWIATLDRQRQEQARILRWGTMIARGRTIPVEERSDATRMPANCYTFQPEVAAKARRIGAIRDFSDGAAQPLESSGAKRLDAAAGTSSVCDSQ